jgi:hypothetical protein
MMGAWSWLHGVVGLWLGVLVVGTLALDGGEVYAQSVGEVFKKVAPAVVVPRDKRDSWRRAPASSSRRTAR